MGEGQRTPNHSNAKSLHNVTPIALLEQVAVLFVILIGYEEAFFIYSVVRFVGCAAIRHH